MLRVVALCLLLSPSLVLPGASFVQAALADTVPAQTAPAEAPPAETPLPPQPALSQPAAPPGDQAQTLGHKLVIFFQEWSARFDDASTSAIAQAAEWAKQHPATTLTVSGFADPTGSVQSNIYLSQLRAERVFDALVDAGVAADRIKRTGRGETNFQLTPLESRRVEITFHDS